MVYVQEKSNSMKRKGNAHYILDFVWRRSEKRYKFEFHLILLTLFYGGRVCAFAEEYTCEGGSGGGGSCPHRCPVLLASPDQWTGQPTQHGPQYSPASPGDHGQVYHLYPGKPIIVM